MRAQGPLHLLVSATLLFACTPGKQVGAHATPTPQSPGCATVPEHPELEAFILANRAPYISAISRARIFLDGLDVEPHALRARGLKGKKKLVEMLDAYSVLYRIASPAERPALLARVQVVARPTAVASYHDMLQIDDHEFHEDATSYLRAALLLDRLGLDIRRYRAEIAMMKGRLDLHMRTRGPHQQRAFHGYYRHFGLEEPFPLGDALEQGLIARKVAVESLSRLDVYAFTHEVYAAYDYGDARNATPFAASERTYLHGTLPRMLRIWLDRGDPDLVAELCTCMSYLRLTGDPVYTEALGALLIGQNLDGSWGDYDAVRARFGDMVKQGFYLHTTMVTIEALAVGFDIIGGDEAHPCRW